MPPGETHERTLSWFDWSLLADISNDGKTVIFSETGEAVGTHYSMFLRKMDGSPAIRLGNGGFGKLSPDGKWVVSEDGAPAKLMLLPTGVGQPQALTDDKINHFGAGWVPDGKSITFNAAEPGHGRRTYLQGIDPATPARPITPEGTLGYLVSPDSQYLLAMDEKRQRWLFPLAGGEPKKIDLSLKPDEGIISFLLDGKSVLVRDRNVPTNVFRVEIATGARALFKEIVPADPAGVQSIPNVRFSADGRSYAYSVGRFLSDLYVVDGLK
jgi:Tol biopolymer transport system component